MRKKISVLIIVNFFTFDYITKFFVCSLNLYINLYDKRT